MIEQSDEMDQHIHNDMVKLMKENSETVSKEYSENSFQRVFWEQQLSNALKKGPNQYKNGTH